MAKNNPSKVKKLTYNTKTKTPSRSAGRTSTVRGKLYAGVEKALESANDIAEKIDKKIVQNAINSKTKKEINKINNRLAKWEDKGFQKNIQAQYVKAAGEIEGLAIRKGRLVAMKDLDEYAIKQLEAIIPTYSALERENERLAKQVRQDDDYKKRQEQQMIARARFYAIQKKLENEGVDELFSLWYEDGESKVRSLSIEGLSEEDLIDLTSELEGKGGLASRMAKDEATPEEIFDFVNRLKNAIVGGEA